MKSQFIKSPEKLEYIGDTHRRLWDAGFEFADISSKYDLAKEVSHDFGRDRNTEVLNMDLALPQSFANNLWDRFGIDAIPYGAVDYSDRECDGKYVNLAELLVEKIRKGELILLRAPEE